MTPAFVVLIGIEIAIGIAIEIEKNYNTNMFDPDPDPDSDPEKTFEKHQTLKLMTLTGEYLSFGEVRIIRISPIV